MAAGGDDGWKDAQLKSAMLQRLFPQVLRYYLVYPASFQMRYES
jgi:hypothetical protein